MIFPLETSVDHRSPHNPQTPAPLDQPKARDPQRERRGKSHPERGPQADRSHGGTRTSRPLRAELPEPCPRPSPGHKGGPHGYARPRPRPLRPFHRMGRDVAALRGPGGLNQEGSPPPEYVSGSGPTYEGNKKRKNNGGDLVYQGAGGDTGMGASGTPEKWAISSCNIRYLTNASK